MPRFLMQVAYDGTNYFGWQVQVNKPSVQAEVEKALSHFTKERAVVTCAGRTDTGVHALAQAAHFDYQGSMSAEQLVLAFRTVLPDDVRVLKVVPVEPDFHARYDAYERTYRYLLAKDKSPFNRNYMGFITKKNLYLERMQAAAPLFLGSHDFSSFGKPNPNIPNRVCEILRLDVVDRTDHYEFTITSDRFLHNMIRRIVGALVNVSHLNLDPGMISYWLEEANPIQRLIFTAPPQGLYFIEVKYPNVVICAT